MTKPILAIDIDDVLMPHYDELAAFLSREFKVKITSLDISQRKSLDMIEASSGLGREEILKRIDAYLLTDDFYLDPYPGAFEALTKLVKHYRLVSITARPMPMTTMTQAWIRKHFPSLFEEIKFVGPMGWGQGSSDKADALGELKVTVLVDDHLRHCGVAAKLGIRTLLFGDYAWNQLEKLPDGIERVHNWDEVLDRLLL
jgi:uncharacterized HAD superfamily protein